MILARKGVNIQRYRVNSYSPGAVPRTAYVLWRCNNADLRPHISNLSLITQKQQTYSVVVLSCYVLYLLKVAHSLRGTEHLVQLKLMETWLINVGCLDSACLIREDTCKQKPDRGFVLFLMHRCLCGTSKSTKALGGFGETQRFGNSN